MSLEEQLTAIKKKTIATRPPELVSIMLEEAANLVKSGIADKVIKAGEPLPEFTLPDEKGNLVRSANLLAQGPLAINFYRGIW
ncbi:hypothetical protein [Desulfospira joergensenii]|uniref:hypothetical protein n=1 Tax=Desulfospira joergensenii TaxID=53329 RepID=UPI000687AD5A|nr:hypothetical protein [Desulfospira joergensenii]